tara:strand:- start:243 stop:470 length:228 start_codon:yes stop_codon:yes gene_type:complete
MNFELFILDGYGQFVWPAFIFTFVSCYILYSKTKKKLQKYEKLLLNEYNEYKETNKTNLYDEKKITKEVWSGSSI